MSFDKKFTGPDGSLRPDCWESGDGKGTYKKGDLRCEGGADPNYFNPTTRSNVRPTCKHMNECINAKNRLIPSTALVRPNTTPFTPPQAQQVFSPFTAPFFQSPPQQSTTTQPTTQPSQPRTFQPLSPPTGRPAVFQPQQQQAQPAVQHMQTQPQVQGIPSIIRPVYPGVPQSVPVPTLQHAQVPTNMAQHLAEQRVMEEHMRLQHMQAASVGASQLINHQYQMAQQAADARMIHQHQSATLGARTGMEAAYGQDISATPVQFDSLLAQHEPWAPNTGFQRFGSELARSSLTGMFMAATRFISFNPWSANFRPRGR